MCFVLFAWLSTQNYFKDLTNLDIRQSLFNEKLKQLEDEMLPLGFLDDGTSLENEGEVDDDGTLWKA